jgi:carotenoid cleavage dioxygenase-like enzyme
MAGPYLVFLVPPVRIAALSVLVGLKSYSEAMSWRPGLGTRILIVDRRTLTLLAQAEADPWFQWHFGNGAVEEGERSLVIDFVRYPDFATNQHLREVADGRTRTPARGTLWRLRLDAATAGILSLEELSDRSVEFPITPAERIGRAWHETFLVAHRSRTDPTVERYDTLACFDHARGALVEADLGDGRYPSEPILVSDAEAARQWLISVVYDGGEERSEVWVFDAAALPAGPACRLALPEVVPLSFHGCWRGAVP